ncbi:MAG: hypothetical protein K9N62_16575 [Verrucomicrobia bacterium]|nr:hypothetical protein [Verrucomicrobiota bacterium]
MKTGLQNTIIAAAKKAAPSDRVPFAFEKRVMARIRGLSGVDVWAVWSRLLWRAAGPCVAIMLAVSLWAAFSNHQNPALNTLSEDLESSVLAPFASLRDSPW